MKKYITIAAVLTVVAVAFLFKDEKALANPVQVISNNNCRTAVATTTYTPMLITAFSNTKTLTCSAYNPDTAMYQGDLMKQAVLSIQMTASSSASTLGFTVQYSKDGIDWFNEDATLNNSSIVNVEHASTTITHRWTPGDTNTNRKAFVLSTPLPYVRVAFTGTTATSTMWAEITPIKELY